MCRQLGASPQNPSTVALDPVFAERRYGGVLDDEMLMALAPEDADKAIEDMTALAKNGFRYPFPQYSIQQDVREGMAKSYPHRRTPE
jgi:hypothetical protein